MARVWVAVVSVLVLSVSGCFGPPTPEQMKQMVIGQWAANRSAMANLGRTMKIGSQNPAASPSEVTAVGHDSPEEYDAPYRRFRASLR